MIFGNYLIAIYQALFLARCKIMENKFRSFKITICMTFKFIFGNFFKFLFHFLAYGFFLNNKKLFKFKIKHIIRFFLVFFCLVVYFLAWLKNYYLFLIGEYELNKDALKYQNKTLKNISRFQVSCDDLSQEKELINQNWFLGRDQRKLRIRNKFNKYCQLNITGQFTARTSNDSESIFIYKNNLSQTDLNRLQINNVSNGFYEPLICSQNSKNTKKNLNFSNQFYELNNQLTVVIIPYLNRKKNLIDLMLNLHGFLQRQLIRYKIIVAEQANSQDPFNKGRLYNAAFKYAYDIFSPRKKINSNGFFNFSCVVLHDVDLVSLRI